MKTMGHGPQALGVACFLLLCVACSAPAPPPAQTTTPPQRIVSLIPAVTETLFAVGAGPQVVGVSDFDTFPPEVASIARVGGLIDPHTERILSLRPDLVFLYGSQTELAQQLSAARIPVEAYRHGGLAGILETIRAVGALVGRAEQGRSLAAAIEQEIAAVSARVAGKPRPSVLIVFGREEGALRGIYASGGVGFIHDMVQAAGGRNVYADLPRESVQASLENILERAPEIILELRAPLRGGAADQAPAPRDPWEAAASVPAVRNGRVHVLRDERLVVPGPRVAGGIDMLARAIHP